MFFDVSLHASRQMPDGARRCNLSFIERSSTITTIIAIMILIDIMIMQSDHQVCSPSQGPSADVKKSISNACSESGSSTVQPARFEKPR